MLDRTLAPEGKPLHNTALPSYHSLTLSNGLPVYLLPHGTVDVVEAQLVFRAGKGFQPQPGVARYTARNLSEGTARRSSLEIAQLLDGYGAWLSNEVDESSIALKLATTTRNLPHTLPLLREILTEPSFPEDEFVKMKQRSAQRLATDARKTSWLAKRLFGRLMYGDAHPYGVTFGMEHLETLELEMLREYHRRYLHAGNAFLTVTGRYDEQPLLRLLEAEFGQLDRPAAPGGESAAAQAPARQTGRHWAPHEGMQASLRLGHAGMPRQHPDYYAMTVVNTILGGYFGSRLMKNIREEKGYTYGIYSAWMSMHHDGYFMVQTDVGTAYIEPAIAEVRREMQHLIEAGVGTEELQLVKNYLIGRSVGQRETAFQMSDVLRYSLAYGLPFEELDRRFDVIREIQPAEVQRLAQEWLRPDGLLEVVAGSPQA